MPLSILVAWFGDSQLLICWLKAINISQRRIHHVYVLDQNRGSQERVENEKVTYISFPKLTTFASLDHASSIDTALNETVFSEDILIVTEVDMVPYSNSWITKILDLKGTNAALVLANPNNPNESHPCLAVFDTSILKKVKFADGLGESKIQSVTDTGRRLIAQLERSNIPHFVTHSKPLFTKRMGFIYSGIKFWHVTSMSLRFRDLASKRNSFLSGFGFLLRLGLMYTLGLFLVLSRKFHVRED